MGLTAENSNAIALGLVGDEWNLMLGLNNIGYVAILSGQLDRAAEVGAGGVEREDFRLAFS